MNLQSLLWKLQERLTIAFIWYLLLNFLLPGLRFRICVPISFQLYFSTLQKSICVDLKWLIAESEHMTRIENPDFSEHTQDGWRCSHMDCRQERSVPRGLWLCDLNSGSAPCEYNGNTKWNPRQWQNINMQNILSPVPALACLLLLFAGKLDLKQHERANL